MAECRQRNDMIFNPSDRVFSNIGGTVYAGGQHWIYVFRNSRSLSSNNGRMPAYDMGQHMYNFWKLIFQFQTSKMVFSVLVPGLALLW